MASAEEMRRYAESLQRMFVRENIPAVRSSARQESTEATLRHCHWLVGEALGRLDDGDAAGAETRLSFVEASLWIVGKIESFELEIWNHAAVT